MQLNISVFTFWESCLRWECSTWSPSFEEQQWSLHMSSGLIAKRRSGEETHIYSNSQLTLILDFLQHSNKITQTPNEPSVQYTNNLSIWRALTICQRDNELLLSWACPSLWPLTELAGYVLIYVLVARLASPYAADPLVQLSQCKVAYCKRNVDAEHVHSTTAQT